MSPTPTGPIAEQRRRLDAALGSDPDRLDVLARFDVWAPDLLAGMAPIYGADVLPRIVDLIAATHAARPAALRDRDRHRVLEPDWFARPDAIGYVAYADLFAGSLAGVAERLDYLQDLSVTYLHLMPLLEPRPGANDGGYAVADYRRVRADLGTMDDLATLAGKLHERGISLTLDLVLNHVAKEHEWARRAQRGEAKYRDYFVVFPDRSMPDAYERTLPEVFPETDPGSFTWDDALGGWVWTTFHEYQWDVNWANPDVFVEFADIIGYLANQGVDCLRLDAIAFLWKRLGTICQNEPEVHAITQALRAFARIVAPSLIFKAEAIVGPEDVVAYLGIGEHAGKVSDLAYHNSLMVQIWSALAASDARLLAQALTRFPPVPTTTAWATYLRCHDDIGWAIDDVDADAVGWDGASHRSFLASYYAGDYYGSPARGAHFQINPETGDRRTSGSAASLAGLEAASEQRSATAIDLAVRRLLVGYAVVFGFGGLPLLYMGDELAMTNDYAYLDDPQKADDNRWMHRPRMDWAQAKPKRGTPARRVLDGIHALIDARKGLPSLHAATPSVVFTADDPALLVIRRRHASGDLVEVVNLAATDRQVPTYALWPLLAAGDRPLREHISHRLLNPAAPDALRIGPYEAWWLTTA